MSALDERLRAHIDALAAPVSRTEATRARTTRLSHERREPRRLTAVAAAAVLLAGLAAIVLVANRSGDAPANQPDPSLQPIGQTTIPFGPTTTVDRAALDATWELSGNWLIVDPGSDSTSSPVYGFVVFHVDTNGTRLASMGHGECFLFSGQTLDTGDTITVTPIPDSDQGAVECDPGETPQMYDATVACLQTGCGYIYDDSTIALTDANAVAVLVPTTGDVFGSQPHTSAPTSTTTTTPLVAPTLLATGCDHPLPDQLDDIGTSHTIVPADNSDAFTITIETSSTEVCPTGSIDTTLTVTNTTNSTATFNPVGGLMITAGSAAKWTVAPIPATNVPAGATITIDATATIPEALEPGPYRLFAYGYDGDTTITIATPTP